jgi:hypothetical protein
MSLTQTQTGFLAVSAGAVEVLSGDDQGLGPTWSHSNFQQFIDANIDGWYEGQGVCVTNVAAAIDLSSATPLTNFAGSGSFKLGFTSAGTYPFAVVFEIVSNASGANADGKGATAKALLIQDSSGNTLAKLSVAGDSFVLLRRNYSTAAAAEFKAALESGVLSVVFKMYVLYRTAQYPT